MNAGKVYVVTLRFQQRKRQRCSENQDRSTLKLMSVIKKRRIDRPTFRSSVSENMRNQLNLQKEKIELVENCFPSILAVSFLSCVRWFVHYLNQSCQTCAKNDFPVIRAAVKKPAGLSKGCGRGIGIFLNGGGGGSQSSSCNINCHATRHIRTAETAIARLSTL